MSNPRPVGGRLVSAAILFFAPLAVLCVLLILKRLVFGIGSVTALNGGYPWGLWIAFDLLVGTGFACGGWALAWTVYIFNKGKYHALVRPALLASLFGYSLGGLSITIDMGRYWHLPYFYIPGQFNTNSVLFETAFCMTVYIIVVTLEFAPVSVSYTHLDVYKRQIITLFGVGAAMFVYWGGSDLITVTIGAGIIGCLIYVPMFLSSLQTIELVPSFAAGSATGLRGLLSYILGSFSGTALFGILADKFGWDAGFYLLLFAVAGCIFCCYMTHLGVLRLERKKAQAANNA